MKRCRKCGVEKPLTEFSLNKVNKDGRGPYCRPCVATMVREYRAKKDADGGYQIDPNEKSRVCSTCEVKKPIAEYYRHKHSPRGRLTQCRGCLSKKYRANAGYYRDAWLRYEYGISRSEYERLLKLQDGHCAVCGFTPDPDHPSDRFNKLHVDHDHTTGEVRGLVCNRCNIAIGRLESKRMRLLPTYHLYDVVAAYIANPPAKSLNLGKFS